jgi:hypothetical protein
MITFKSSFNLLVQGVLTAALLTACQEQKHGTGEIPYDQRNAQRHVISVSKAVELTKRYRQGKIELLRQLRSPDYLDKSFSMPEAEMFNRDAIALLLNQKGAKGMRIYVGQDDKGLIRFVLVGVDAKGEDIIGKRDTLKRMAYTASSEGSSAIILEVGQRCPTLCSTLSTVN